MKRLFLVLCVSLLAFSAVAQKSVQLTFIETSDIHGAI